MNSAAAQVTFRVLWLFEDCQTVFHLKKTAAASYKRSTGRNKRERQYPGLENETVKIVGSRCDRISSKASCEENDMYFTQHW